MGGAVGSPCLPRQHLRIAEDRKGAHIKPNSGFRVCGGTWPEPHMGLTSARGQHQTTSQTPAGLVDVSSCLDVAFDRHLAHYRHSPQNILSQCCVQFLR